MCYIASATDTLSPPGNNIQFLVDLFVNLILYVFQANTGSVRVIRSRKVTLENKMCNIFDFAEFRRLCEKIYIIAAAVV